MKKINVITLFSGYDSQCLALRRLGLEFDLVAWSEIDRSAIKAHDILFPEFANRNVGDVTSADWSQITKEIDLLTYSSPCQDISSAGKQRGGDKGSGTRSSLLWDVERAVSELRPRYLLMENVPNMLSDKFFKLFRSWCRLLEGYGYHNSYQLMNAKCFGVPQSRKRLFLISKLNDEAPYYFPHPFPLKKRLKDIIESDVDESYYLSDCQKAMMLQHLHRQQERGNGFGIKPKTEDAPYANAITTLAGSIPGDNYIAMLGWTRGSSGKVVNRHEVDVANCVTASRRDNMQNYVIIKVGNNDKAFKILENGNIRCFKPESGAGISGYNYTSIENVSPTITTENHTKIIDDLYRTSSGINGSLRIRRLTPRELYRLMDVDEKSIDKLLTSDIAKTNHAKLAGNSIVISCLCHIFDRLFIHTQPTKNEQLKLF